MFHLWALLALFLVSACGGPFVKFSKEHQQKRQIAGVALSRLLSEESKTFEAEIEDNLNSLHSYYVIAAKNLYQLEDMIQESNLQELYRGQHYLSLLAVRTQIDGIEGDFKELLLTMSDTKKLISIKNQILKFSKIGPVHYRSVENLSFLLKIDLKEENTFPNKASIEKEYTELEKRNDFKIYEKNIEHLSHLMELNLENHPRKFAPSENNRGTISGQEFPAKVWALTFSSGPHENITPKIVQKLKEQKFKATFFQEADKSSKLISTARRLIDAGMEVGTQGHSNKELSKVGHMTLEKEITVATRSMEKNLKIDIKFYRLPYASGIEVPLVRGLIAKNNLIHVFWNIDSLDWIPQSPDRIVKRTKDLMKRSPRDAGIILFHDVHSRSVVASGMILDYLKQDARRVCTLGTIVEEMNRGEKTVCSQKSL